MSDKPFTHPELGPHALRPRVIRKHHGDEGFLTDFRYEAPREDPALPEVYVYTDAMSYDPGDEVQFHASCNAEDWNIQIYRDGHQPEMVHETFGLEARFTPMPDKAYMNGCGWPVLHRWTLPADLRSGFYRVVSTCMRPDGNRFVQHHFFVVRPTPATRRGSIVMMLATGTWTAYNDWGGANHYFGTYGPNQDEGSPILSLERPWSRGLVWLPKGAARTVSQQKPNMGDAHRYPSKEYGYSGGWAQYYAAAGYAQFDRHFLVWAEEQGFEIDIITQTDLHFRPELLEGKSCLISCGHDEYWSWDMRKTVDGFVEGGGNFARFGGNFLWQIRLEDDGRQQHCWKFKAPTEDPVLGTDRAHLLTTSWEGKGVEWPGASTVGVNGCHGMYASWGGFGPRGNRGFTVYRPEHWVFDGTDLRYADIFGEEAAIFGYEVDGLNYTFHQGLPYPVEEPGVPQEITILAMSPAMLYEYEHPVEGVPYYLSDSDLVGLMSLAPEDTDAARKRYQHGSGMLVHMPKGAGEVVCGGSCEWIMGLTRRDEFTMKITKNVIERFSRGSTGGT
ncbi:MAG: N,N-dimethylformamidase beta subunit family domain-containing protein [Pseudooceanicola sp.]